MVPRDTWIGRAAAAAITVVSIGATAAAAAPRRPLPPVPDRIVIAEHATRVGVRLASEPVATTTDRRLLGAARTYLARSQSALALGSLVAADQYAAASDDLANAIDLRSEPPPNRARHGRLAAAPGPGPGRPAGPPRPPRPARDGDTPALADLSRTIDRVSTTLETVSNVSAAPGSVERQLTDTASSFLDDARLRRTRDDADGAVRDARRAEAIARATLHVALAKNPTDAALAPPGPPGPPRPPHRKAAPPGDGRPPAGRP